MTSGGHISAWPFPDGYRDFEIAFVKVHLLYRWQVELNAALLISVYRTCK